MMIKNLFLIRFFTNSLFIILLICLITRNTQALEVTNVTASFIDEDEKYFYIFVVVTTDDYVPPPSWHVVVQFWPIAGGKSPELNIGNGSYDNYYEATISIEKQLITNPPLYVQAGINHPGETYWTAKSDLFLPKDEDDDPFSDNDPYSDDDPYDGDDNNGNDNPSEDSPIDIGECSSKRKSELTMGSDSNWYYDPEIHGPIGEISGSGSVEKMEPIDIEDFLHSMGNEGYPVLSIDQKTFSIIAEDTPLWFKTGIGLDIKVSLTYRGRSRELSIIGGTQNTKYYPFGTKWFFSFGSFYQEELDGERVRILMSNGNYLVFKYDSIKDEYIPPIGSYAKFERINSEYILSLKTSRLLFHFNDPISKKLTSIEDQNDNQIIIHYDTDYNIDYITDANNRRVEFSLDPTTHLITEIKDPIGRTAQFQYDPDGFLKQITDMGGYTSLIKYESVPVGARFWAGSSNETRITSITTPFGETLLDYEVPATSFEMGAILSRISVTNSLV